MSQDTLEGGDYTIHYSHLHAGKKLRELPSGYLKFLVDVLAEGGLNPTLRENLKLYLAEGDTVLAKVERGAGVPDFVVVKGFKPFATTAL